MKIIIAYLLLVLGVLSMEINFVVIEDQCPICVYDYDRRCISLNLRKPIVLHKNENGVDHEVCEKCLLKLIVETPMKCLLCRYPLSLQEKNKLPKKILKWKNAMLSDRTLVFRIVLYLANFIMPIYETCTYGINLYMSGLFAYFVFLEFDKRFGKRWKLSMCLLLTGTNILAVIPSQQDDPNSKFIFLGENYRCCDYIDYFAIIQLFIIPFVMGIVRCIAVFFSNFFLCTVAILFLTKLIISVFFNQFI